MVRTKAQTHDLPHLGDFWEKLMTEFVPAFVLIHLNAKWVMFQLYHGENQGSNPWSTTLGRLLGEANDWVCTVLIHLNAMWVMFQLYHGENQGSNPWSTTLEASILTIIPSMQFCWYTCMCSRYLYQLLSKRFTIIKGNVKSGVSPRLKIRPCDPDLWSWKSIGFQILLRSKYVPGLVKIHWRMLILGCSQGCYAVKIWLFDLWPWKSIGSQTLLRTMHVPILVKIHWRMLILECSQGCYAVKIWPGDIDLWRWKSIGFQTLLRTKYVPSLVKIHWRKLILKCSQGCYAVKIWPGDLDHWHMTLKINRVPDSLKD
jgi:hypothetical protein